MSFFNYKGYTTVSNGRGNGRSSHQSVMQGRVTVSGTDSDGKKFSRVVEIVDGEIMDNSLVVNGKLLHHIAYGRFETEVTPAGRNVTRFYKGSGKGRHGKSVYHCKLFDTDVIVHSWYKTGRLVRQKVIYVSTGKLAYDWKGKSGTMRVYTCAGNDMCALTGTLSSNHQWAGRALLDRPMHEWFNQRAPFSVEKDGKVWYAGEYRNHQRFGRWIENGKAVFYEHGVPIPEKLFNTAPEKLDLKKLLKIPNAQLRMAMLEKARGDRHFGKRLAAMGKVIHRDGKMRLYAVRGLDTRVLLVVCPSTGSRYFINVPHDSTNCEDARQWTFHLHAGVRTNGNQIKFSQET